MSTKVKENKNNINTVVSDDFNKSELIINNDKIIVKVNKIH
ncbi:hypothetical protein [Anaerosalibacter massiliensis]|nr:hypothetical protein [Anaerosalibacter massiliensis]